MARRVPAVEMVVCTHPGQLREQNEDALLADSGLGFALLADGMGGYQAGEVASGLAVGTVAEELRHAFAALPAHLPMLDGRSHGTVALEEAIAHSNDLIWQLSRGRAEYAGMGTTLVAALFFDNLVCVGHVGDSRLYRLREGDLERLTKDHSLLQEQIDNGIITPEEARVSSNRNLVTRALGVEFAVQAEIQEVNAAPGDVYLLCSDGLTDMLNDQEIRSIMFAFPGQLAELANRLVDEANRRGGRDNISVILVRVRRPYPAETGVLAKLERLFT